MSAGLHFDTTVSTTASDGSHLLRGKALTECIDDADFVSTFFLSLTGREPTQVESRLLNAMLVASLDHGVEPSSMFVPRVVASTGNEMLHCMATSLLALGPLHGGAITGAMEMFYSLKDKEDKEQACVQLVEEFRAKKKRVPGYGHPKYKDKTTGDPRAQQLLQMAEKGGLDTSVTMTARILENTLEWKLNKVLVLNIDGAMAALLTTFGIAPEAGNGIFGVARVAGSIAHIVEEQESDAGVRRLA
ncbi:MAG: hypothetical protein H6774_01200 [Pseudomonadales bacterium]|nr:hypothetical protein [Candidatus Woesebacteria bacterium]MCB9801683.1 hypothetical protein [Pseudomonadales bacterium]